MSQPIRAIRLSQLQMKVSSELAKSGHAMSMAEFIDTDGLKKIGFFKPVDETYPPLLLFYAVATSCLARYTLGDERAAEDMVVVDNHGEIVGSLSVGIPNYKPLMGTSLLASAMPEDPVERELVYPSVETLLRANVAELLVSAWYLGNDDLHPDNLSLYELIDWDMYFYWITHAMKGDRAIDDSIIKASPVDAMKLLASHILNFPRVSGRTHWPANNYPGNYTYWKRFASVAAFQELTKNPEIIVEGRPFPVCFQEQMFDALLKELLLFDPIVLRRRLEQYLSGFSLNYFALPEEKRAILEREHPNLFKHSYNHKPFVDHILEVFQLNYDNLSRATLFFMGDINIEGQSVPGFYQYLESRPSALKRIVAFAENQNMKLREKRMSNKSEAGSSTSDSQSQADIEHNIKFIINHYHKIWRDAHTGVLRKALDDLKTLKFQLTKQIKFINESRDHDGDQSLFTVALTPIQSSEIIETLADENLVTEAWQIIGEPELKESQSLDNLNLSLSLLEAMTRQIHEISCAYYKLSLSDLTMDTNKEFTQMLYNMVHSYQQTCLPLLGTGEFPVKFTSITTELKRFCSNFNLEEHLQSDDKPFPVKALSASKMQIARHLEPETIQAGLSALFDWVNTLEKNTHGNILTAFILSIIDSDYEPKTLLETWTLNRQRANQIRSFLKDERYANQSNSWRLAIILSEGGKGPTSLNTKIITGLIGVMLDDTHGITDNKPAYCLNSLREVYALQAFNSVIYTEHAVEYVLKDTQFSDVPGNVHYWNNFGERLYEWINAAGLVEIKKIMTAGLELYKSKNARDNSLLGRMGLFGKSRKESIEQIISNLTPDNLCFQISLVLKEKTGMISSSSDWCLMDTLLTAIKKDISTDSEKIIDPKYKFLLSADMSEQRGGALLSKMKEYADRYIEEHLKKFDASSIGRRERSLTSASAPAGPASSGWF